MNEFCSVGRAASRTRWIYCLVLLLGLAPGRGGAAGAGTRVLPGHVPAVVANLAAAGRLPATNRLRLSLGVPMPNRSAADDFLGQLYDPAHPQYRHYLTPDEFAARFSPSPADYATVAAFAAAHQLTVVGTHPSRFELEVVGAVADIETAFQVTLSKYHHPTEARDFFAPDREPTVDVRLPLVEVGGLSDFARPQPRLRQLDGGSPVPRAATGSGYQGGFIGNDFRAAYAPNTTLTGAGQIVGLLEFDSYYASDVTAYENAAHIAPVTLQEILLDSGTTTPTTGAKSGDSEVTLDIDMAIAMAPGLSKVVIFNAGPTGSQNHILAAMVTNTAIKQFSCSWGWPGGPSQTTDNYFIQMAMQGQSFFTASGDSDAYSPGSTSANGVDNTSLGGAPASSPYVTSVGGTTLTTSGPGGAWVSETVWNWGLQSAGYAGSGGGISSHYGLPTWQAGLSMTANGGSTAWRNLPDVALTADNVAIYYNGNATPTVLGGTSCAAPLWAGLTALMNQKLVLAGQPSVGFLNPAVYSLGRGAGYAAAFHDITTGNNFNGVSPNLFSAVAGYDLCTGWGTPTGEALIDALTGPPDPLGVSPATGFSATGQVGGPFANTNTTYTLTNGGSGNLPWAVLNPAAWLSAVPAAGVLAPGAVTNVTVQLSAAANLLAPGVYMTNVVFTNANTGAGVFLLFSLQTGQSLVVNGGFETGDFTGWTVVGTANNSATTYNDVVSSSQFATVVHSGTYGAFLGDDIVARFSQTLTTTPGHWYLVSFWLANPQAATTGNPDIFRMYWITNASAPSLIYNRTNGAILAWTQLKYVLAATGNSTTLQFQSQNNTYGFGLDDVSVLPLPSLQFSAVTTSGSSVTLSWNSLAGVGYQVQYSASAAPTAWTALGGKVTASGVVTSVTDNGALAGGAQRFYRLVLGP